MFTGLISETTTVLNSEPQEAGLKLSFSLPETWTDLAVGESISTNGVCLSVETIKDKEYSCFLVPETLEKTTFGCKIPAVVNLERSLKVSDRLGGHFVQGHVDTTGEITQILDNDEVRYVIKYDSKFNNLIIPKGSVAVNGVSLTVAGLQENTFSVALIPTTLSHTTFNLLAVGDYVNLEFDMIGKYIIRMSQVNKESLGVVK